MLAPVIKEVRTIYRQSKKARDNFWTEYVSRPPAALIVYFLRNTKITPNQVSFLAIAIALLGAATLVGWRTWLGLGVAGALLQLAYIVDCVDGQLARLTQQTSAAGALLDFLLDEIKAYALLAASAVRLWLQTQKSLYLLIGLGVLFAAACGITLTTFIRRPEYLEAIGAPPLLPATERASFLPKSMSPVALVEALGRLVLHYPTWFLAVCAVNRLDYFLFVYGGAHVLYLGRTALVVLWKLGRSRREPLAQKEAQQ